MVMRDPAADRRLLFAQISTCNFYVAFIGQLPASDLPLHDQFEPGSMEMIGFNAAFRRRHFRKNRLKDRPLYPHDPSTFANEQAAAVSSGEPAGLHQIGSPHPKPFKPAQCGDDLLQLGLGQPRA